MSVVPQHDLAARRLARDYGVDAGEVRDVAAAMSGIIPADILDLALNPNRPTAN